MKISYHAFQHRGRMAVRKFFQRTSYISNESRVRRPDILVEMENIFRSPIWP